MQLTDAEIAVLAQTIFPFLVLAAVSLYKLILSRLPEARRAVVEDIVTKAVHATEQAQSLVPSQVKKQYATDAVNRLLKAAHVSATPEQIDTLIEAAVYAINQQSLDQKTQTTPAVKR